MVAKQGLQEYRNDRRWEKAISEAGLAVLLLSFGEKLEYVGNGIKWAPGIAGRRNLFQFGNSKAVARLRMEMALLLAQEAARYLDTQATSLCTRASTNGLNMSLRNFNESGKVTTTSKESFDTATGPVVSGPAPVLVAKELVRLDPRAVTDNRTEDEQIADELRQGAEKAKEILCKNWNRVQQLGRALCEGRRLSKDQVVGLIGQVQ